MQGFFLVSIAVQVALVVAQGNTPTKVTAQPQVNNSSAPANASAIDLPKIIAVNCTQAYFEITDSSINGTTIGACKRFEDSEGSFCKPDDCIGSASKKKNQLTRISTFPACLSCKKVTVGATANSTVVSNSTVDSVVCRKDYFFPGPGSKSNQSLCTDEKDDNYICSGVCTSFASKPVFTLLKAALIASALKTQHLQN
ncbi:hypothetical protein PPACK8108_LOCUS21797 [Phakopsora pachyrhizi]|uniref:Secreted protein n=1 Tax=Phakopsora pachyrhizi TaxID=170000 RepID=A0AAV0BK83_PHAPC|nr:hypothetical protein PPACK8108_LOCUS21797 [Phakopsora pachyrhizi]